MKTNRGKGYFYAMGQRDSYYSRVHHIPSPIWPAWAADAYINGFNGWGL